MSMKLQYVSTANLVRLDKPTPKSHFFPTIPRLKATAIIFQMLAGMSLYAGSSALIHHELVAMSVLYMAALCSYMVGNVWYALHEEKIS